MLLRFAGEAPCQLQGRKDAGGFDSSDTRQRRQGPDGTPSEASHRTTGRRQHEGRDFRSVPVSRPRPYENRQQLDGRQRCRTLREKPFSGAIAGGELGHTKSFHGAQYPP
jgi:hypothetical protein